MTKIREWKEKDVLIFFLPPYSPELNLIEILWRRIKDNWMPIDAYLCFQNLKERLSFVLSNFGTKYDIIFRPLLIIEKRPLIKFTKVHLGICKEPEKCNRK